MLKNKVAVITGSTRGIGYSIAKKFLENNCKVVILGTNENSVLNAVESLKQENNNYEVIGFYPNLTLENEMNELFSKINDIYGKIDILVNNAGISSNASFLEYNIDDYEKINDVNMKAVFVCSKACVPYLKESKGVILNTSSMVSIYGQPKGVLYPASKFFVNGFTKSLARELAPFNIRVNAVAPGIIETDMVRNLPKEVIEPLIKTIPLGRVGDVDDVANAFLFLASDMASYITGEILQVDGGARS